MTARFLIFFLASCLAAVPPVMAAGAAYVVRSPSVGMFDRPNAVEPTHTLIKDQIVTVLQRRGDWLRIITAGGVEGWVRETSLAALPAVGEEESRINEESPDEVEDTALYDFVIGPKRGNIRRKASVKSSIVRTAEAGEVFSISAESGSWYQLTREGKVVGWAHDTVGEKKKSRNLRLRLTELVEGKLAWFDKVKSEGPHFRRSGRYPSFFLRLPERDIEIEKREGAGAAVTIHLSYALRDIEYGMVIDGTDRFSTPGANRVFLSDLMLSAIDMFSEVGSVRVMLWFAALKEDGTLSWRLEGEVELGAEEAKAVSREEKVAEGVWSVLGKDTIPGELWHQPPQAPAAP